MMILMIMINNDDTYDDDESVSTMETVAWNQRPCAVAWACEWWPPGSLGTGHVGDLANPSHPLGDVSATPAFAQE